MTRKVFDRLNRRRHELISKKFSVGLSKAEEQVYERLQNSDLLNYYVHQDMDFRPLIRILAELKEVGRRLYPHGLKPAHKGRERETL